MMLKLYFVLMMICFLSVVRGIHFLGNFYSDATWKSLKQRVQCQSSKGYWTNNSTAHHIFETMACDNPWHHQGNCPRIDKGNLLNYNWVLHGGVCQDDLKPFSATHMCQLFADLGGILIIGDSINQQLYYILLNAFYAQANTTCLNCVRSTCVNDIPCYLFHSHTKKHYLRVSNIRNDHVSLTEVNRFDGPRNVYEYPWLQHLRDNNDTALLVLNRGAHYEPTRETISELNKTLFYITSHFPKTSIMWRNTYPGVPDATASFYREPLTAPEPVKHKYDWEQFALQNVAIENFLDINYPQVLVLNVHTSQVLRHDSRVDSLHICIPGAGDNWAILLYNALHIVAQYGE
jgi:hypothetical protein